MVFGLVVLPFLHTDGGEAVAAGADAHAVGRVGADGGVQMHMAEDVEIGHGGCEKQRLVGKNKEVPQNHGVIVDPLKAQIVIRSDAAVVMIAEDEPLAPVQPLHIAPQAFLVPAHGEIPQVIHDILLPDHGIPPLDEGFIILLNAAERRLIKRDDIPMPEMRVRGKKDVHGGVRRCVIVGDRDDVPSTPPAYRQRNPGRECSHPNHPRCYSTCRASRPV